MLFNTMGTIVATMQSLFCRFINSDGENSDLQNITEQTIPAKKLTEMRVKIKNTIAQLQKDPRCKRKQIYFIFISNRKKIIDSRHNFTGVDSLDESICKF